MTQDAASCVPAFMQRHLDLLAELGTPTEPMIDVGGQMSASAVLATLRQLQTLTEKPSAAPMPTHESFRTELAAFQNLAYLLVRFASRYEDCHKEPPVAAVICPPEGSDWIAPIPFGSSRRQWKFTDFGIRQNGSINWRRCYLLFTARTLLGMKRFGPIFPSQASSPFSTWRDWWQEWVHPRLGPEQQGSLDWFGRCTLRR